MIDVFAVVIGLLISFGIGFVYGRFSVNEETPDEVALIEDAPTSGAEPKRASFANDFSVTGKPRTVPWHIRRKELEAAARTKRKKLESFQEYL